MAERLAAYIRKHNIPATVNPDGTIQTINEYLDRDGVFHSEPIKLEVSVMLVREWLGY